MTDYSLATLQKALLLLFSFCLVAFGQPAWVWWWGVLAAVFGYACFWRVLLSLPSKSARFGIAMGWFAGVQVVQLSWGLSHPYLYIYGILLFTAWLFGAQWGLIALFITPQTLKKASYLAAIAGLWAILEWSRLFILSGFPFGPIGLALTGSIYSLQFAALGGIYWLSYWIILTNLWILRLWIEKKLTFISGLVGIIFAFLPYAFGAAHLYWHTKNEQEQASRKMSVLLVQTGFSVEEKLSFQSHEEAQKFVLNKWRQIFELVAKHQSEPVELILLPENLVPYGTYDLIFPVQMALETYKNVFGSQALQYVPVLGPPYADFVRIDNRVNWLVNHAFFSQALANLFQAHVVIGLEDQLYVNNKREETYSAALHFTPNSQEIKRYEKRVLVPMGEYIPFECCRELAAKYGVYGSFTAGREARLFNGPVLLGPSICYEEAFGHLTRESCLKGAEMLVNLTNDGWYPHSKLPKQHFDHSRLRTVENGVPLVRACNTGITGGIDSLGRIVATCEMHSTQEEADTIRIDMPTYHYKTLYTEWGDYFVLGLSFFSIFFALFSTAFSNRNS